MEKRRILCFCERWESGGIESFLHNILSHMDLSKLEVDIVAASLKPSVFTQALQARGVRFLELSGSLRSAKNFFLFRQLLRERRYHVAHFNLFQGLSLCYVWIAKKEGVPVRIAHSHGAALRKSVTKPIKLLLHRTGGALFSGSATEFWACSQLAAEFLFPKDKRKTKGYHVIPNGIDAARFGFDPVLREQMRGELQLGNQFVVGHVGRLDYLKNQDFLLDVFAALHRNRPDCHLLLVGDGDDRGKLERKMQSLKLEDAVTFYGNSGNVEALLCAMDVFVFPSRSEGLGIAVIEAQSAGLPVLCSDRVPRQVHLTEHVRFLSLDSAPELWAETALSMSASAEVRAGGADRVKAAGFDVREVAAMVEKSYEAK